MQQDNFGLPQALGDGLLLRWATAEDIDAVARYNFRILGVSNSAEEGLSYWTKELMDGSHPTTTAADFTIVVDTNNDNQIVSSLNLISQTWAYDGVPFGVGRVELVSTHPDYRRRGLIQAQMEAVHAKSVARGELLQVITGIGWFYRQFGYTMALNLGGNHGGGRQFFWVRPGNDTTIEEEPYRLRRPTYDDIPTLQALYRAHCAASLLTMVRDEALWRYEIDHNGPEDSDRMNFYLIETEAAEVVGYVDYEEGGTSFVVSELGVSPGHSWRAVALFLARYFKREADKLNPSRVKPITNVNFALGETHPVYEALGRQLDKIISPWTYYVRMPDLLAFLRLIAPVLEKRLSSSVLAGYSGTLRLNLYRQHISLIWEVGRLQTIGTYEAKSVEDGEALFPEYTFVELLLGYRSLGELSRNWTDCYADSAEAEVLINILFPKRPSEVIPLG